MNLKYQQELLQQVAAGVNRERFRLVANIQVTFVDPEDGREFEFSLERALDALANDIYWDERGNWADCRTARVEVI